MSVFTALWTESSETNSRGHANDVWLYAGMQSTDTGLASLVNCPVCPVTDGTEPKIQHGQAEAVGVRPGRNLELLSRVYLGRAWPGFGLDRENSRLPDRVQKSNILGVFSVREHKKRMLGLDDKYR